MTQAAEPRDNDAKLAELDERIHALESSIAQIVQAKSHFPASVPQSMAAGDEQ